MTKSISAKRIAAVAASLLVGLAAAGQGVTFGNIPIINSQGQPVVQIVVGSTAMPSDGVVAANIAAVIGSLAHTSTNITATVGGRSGVNCVVTTATCSLSNQQVWLGEQGLVVPTGSYSFSALIGSVLNPAVLNSGNLQYSKTLSGSTASNWGYPNQNTAPYPITSNPTATSVYAGIGISPATSVTASTNGGGLQFTRFTNNSEDNILRLSSTQVPGLLSSFGSYQETEYLWLAGFPVYNQNTGALSVLDTNGAYQVQFGKPIQNMTNGQSTNAGITFLGQNWTVYGQTDPKFVSGISSNSFILGGNVTLAQASTPVDTVYVGHNITSGPFTVVLNDLSYPNSNGVSNAALSIYNNGVLTNVTSAGPAGQQNVVINSSGTKLYVKVSQTFPGLYAYQKWAKIQLFSNTVNVTSGKNFNSANGNNWLVALRWTTNQSAGATTQAMFNANAALQSIILYSNQSTQVTMTPGSSMSFIKSPAAWNVNFAGDSLGTPGNSNSNYDPLTFTTGFQNAVTYSLYGQNVITPTYETFTTAGAPGAGATTHTINITTVTEPVNLLTVASSIPTAFQVSSGTLAAPTSNLQSLQYNLDPYVLDSGITTNSVDAPGTANVLALANGGISVGLFGNANLPANTVTNTNPLNVQIVGYRPGVSTTTSYTVTFTANGVSGGTANSGNGWQTINGLALGNLTGVTLSYAIPNPGVKVVVYETSNTAQTGAPFLANSVLLGNLNYVSSAPTLLYKVPQYSYNIAPAASTEAYTGENNNVNFAISASTVGSGSRNQYFTYNVPEITLPTASTPNANVIIGLTNSSTIDSTPLYWINTTNGNNNAVTYQSSQNSQVKAVQGFRTERGGDVASISTSTLVYDEPKTLDGLRFVIGPATTGSTNVSTSKLFGPYTVGQATNIPNVTIGKVNATCVGSGASVCSVTGLANLTATPSAAQAVVPTLLNTATTPLAVLDSNANQASTLIVVGSKYVNSVAGQIFAQNPSFNQSFGTSSVVVQAFGTNRVLVAGYSAGQTVSAGNQFIQALLANATV